MTRDQSKALLKPNLTFARICSTQLVNWLTHDRNADTTDSTIAIYACDTVSWVPCYTRACGG